MPSLRFDGRRIDVHEGDTIAAAAYRAGVRTFSRSLKAHRRRGLYCGTGDCANCLVTVDGLPGERACVTSARDGMRVDRETGWPSTERDLLAINDFHGNLEPPTGSGGRVGTVANDAACTEANNCVFAGGVAYLADDIKDLEATNPNTLVVSAGDNIGASPLLSAAFHDEPTIEALNLLGLDVSSVGNHEFDEGVDELLRIQNGGCHPTDGCQTGHTYAGADFDILAANVVYKDSGDTILPATSVKTVDGVKVGFIGLTLEGTPNIVSAAGIVDVNFLDEAETINAATAALRSQGVKTIVVLIHEGGSQSVPISTANVPS